jgi:hypothetical protein
MPHLTIYNCTKVLNVENPELKFITGIFGQTQVVDAHI